MTEQEISSLEPITFTRQQQVEINAEVDRVIKDLNFKSKFREKSVALAPKAFANVDGKVEPCSALQITEGAETIYNYLVDANEIQKEPDIDCPKMIGEYFGFTSWVGQNVRINGENFKFIGTIQKIDKVDEGTVVNLETPLGACVMTITDKTSV